MEGRRSSQQAALTQDFPSAPPFYSEKEAPPPADDLEPDLKRQLSVRKGTS